MRIKEQTWMSAKHDKASSIQVAGTEMGEKCNNSSKINHGEGQKRASTVLRGGENTTQNDSDVYQDYLS